VFAAVALPSSDARFELARRDCAQGTCALAVRASGGEVKLGWPVPAGAAVEEAEAAAPPGLPFALARPHGQRWRLGAEEGAVVVAATPLAGAPGGPALLLQAEVGYEHVKRLYAVVSLSAGHPALAWQREDGAGPHVSAAGVAGGQVVYFDAFQDPGPDQPDTVLARALPTAPGGTDRPTDRPLSEVHAAVAGPFPSVAAAKKARENPCWQGALVLPAASFPGERRRGFLLAGLAAEKALADGLARKLSACSPPAPGAKKVRVVRWQSGSGS
jgi:hypothetical protein